MPANSDLNSQTCIAVVGRAARFPGAPSVDQFWRNIRDGVESIRALSDDELREAQVREALLSDPTYVKRGAPLDNMEGFDAQYFGFNPKDAAIMDPQHRHFLECSVEALENAGYAPEFFPGSIGVFAGSGMHAYMMFNLVTNPDLVEDVGLFLLRHTGNDKDFLCTRASYELNLTGPSVNVQTACSTSLVAIHVASQNLLNGECDIALAGGVTIEIPHRRGYLYQEGEILSPDGHCRAFDASSKGTVFGSGVGVVVLRRLEDAINDGDQIYAVIRGSAVNNDGSTKVGYLAPSVDGQAAALAEALAVAGVDPNSITYIETHGTGTPVGDPIEIAALQQGFGDCERKQFCAIGSVKTNIGHTDTAAGVAGFIKTVEALRHKKIPPSLHFREPNSAIDFAQSPFYVNAALSDWSSRDTPRRACVNSIGVGGTNAHVVLEEAPSLDPSEPSHSWQLLTLSAKTSDALEAATTNLSDHLREYPDLNLADAAYTLQLGRSTHRYRRSVVADNPSRAADALENPNSDRVNTNEAPDAKRSIAFMFAGGGAQYPTMGLGLYDHEPTYRQEIDRCLEFLDSQIDFDLRSLLYPDSNQMDQAAAELERPSRALPALFITQYAQARLWMSWGIEPEVMIGHSMGEYTAACLAGVFSPEDAMRLVLLRGRLFERLPKGTMLSVPLGQSELEQFLSDDLSIAAVNAPDLCAASGPVASIDKLEARLGEREIDAQRIRIAVAAHSSMLDDILEDFREYCQTLDLRSPQIPVASNLSGAWLTAQEACDPEYWTKHLRHTVRFADGIGLLLQQSERTLLEIGPGRTLATLSRMHSDFGSNHMTITSMRHPDEHDSDCEFMLKSLGEMWLAGIQPSWDSLHQHQRRRRVALPTYPFEHRRYWIDAEPSAIASIEQSETALERRPDPSDWFYRPVWKPEPLAADDIKLAGRRFLVFADDHGFADLLTTRLRDGGARVRVVQQATEFAQLDDTAYTVHTGDSGDFERLVQSVWAQELPPTDVLHMWSLSVSPSDVTPDNLGDVEERSFYSLMLLAQALGTHDVTAPLRLTVLTNGAQQVGAETVPYPTQALVAGPCQVIPRELPNIAASTIDLDGLDVKDGAWLEPIVAELGTDQPTAHIALRGRERLVKDWEHVRLHTKAVPRLREGGVYIITGGLGGIGLTVAESIARRVNAKLVLTARTRFPDRNEWVTWLETHPDSDPTRGRVSKLQEIEALGSEVLPITADVMDEDEMNALVAQAKKQFGAIHGVVHAAGILNDGLLQLKERGDVDGVLGPKVRGTLVLDRCLADVDLDFFISCSSISTITGPAGQIDYVAANAFLNAFAHHQAARHSTFACAINWPAWREVGMAAKLLNGAVPSTDSPSSNHPLLERCVENSGPMTVYTTDLAAAEHWVLSEHRLRDGPHLMPGAAYLELARAAFAAAPEECVEFRDVFFVSPFAVDPDGKRELMVQIHRNGTTAEFEFVSVTESGKQQHARGEIAQVPRSTPERLGLDEVAARCNSRSEEFNDTDHHQQIAFGPRWGCLKRIDYGLDEALVSLELSAEYIDDLQDFKLHPAMLDMATAGAQSLIHDFDPTQDFYVPVGYGRLLLSGELPPRLVSHIRYRPNPPGQHDRDVAVFDVTVMDESGLELVLIEEFTMQRVPADSASSLVVAGKSVPIGSEYWSSQGSAQTNQLLARALELGLDPDEGADAFERILSGQQPGAQVVVSPYPLAAIIEDAASMDEHDAGTGEPPLEQPTELKEVEKLLVDLNAITAAGVRAFRDRNATQRVAAFVVYDSMEQTTVSELRRHIRKNVSQEFVPQQFVEIDDLPLTPTGGINYADLPNPFAEDDDYVAPRTETEKQIATIWRGVLGIERVSVHDNFFDIGGHSLLGIRVITRVNKQLGIRLNQAIMVLQTLEQIARECDTAATRVTDGEETSKPQSLLSSVKAAVIGR